MNGKLPWPDIQIMWVLLKPIWFFLKNGLKPLLIIWIKEGVSSERVVVQYFGEEKPIADNDTKEGRQQNRRVEMTIIFE